MASKKNYLIKVWQTASKKKIDDSDVDKDKHYHDDDEVVTKIKIESDDD